MKVLGVDPGLDTTGWAVVSQEGSRLRALAYGVIRTRPRDCLEERLAQLYQAASRVMRDREPEAVALEALYSAYTHPGTAILMGHARGVVCLCAAQQRVPVFHYGATQVKRSLTGRGRASKEQVQGMVGTLLGLDLSKHPADVADALALALCHCNIASRPARIGGRESGGGSDYGGSGRADSSHARIRGHNWLRRKR